MLKRLNLLFYTKIQTSLSKDSQAFSSCLGAIIRIMKQAFAMSRDGARCTLSVEQLLTLLKFCLNTTYFVLNGNFYQQNHGAVMGSPVSPLDANIYMEDFEARALSTAPTNPQASSPDRYCLSQNCFVFPTNGLITLGKNLATL